ncbi:PLDc N-terminal domain-containing protein [Actinosynnema sp. NPDC020468]|uniref:PLDc N-terminal domain-containing protein n=1 Tax=Actinosynnema sp. NPDC020468 TaxID=3154488 RepID=UPI0033E76B39
MKKKWSELGPVERAAVLALGSVQVALAAAAWADLATRPAARVNGPKKLWALLIGVNFVGPLSYFRWGRRPAQAEHRER